MKRPGWLIEEPADVYHAKAAENLSSHQLADFHKSPYLYWKKHSGLIAEKDSPAYAFGRAAHTLILEGRETFEREYAIGGPINPETGDTFGASTKAYAAWLADSGKQSAVTNDEMIKLERMELSVRVHSSAYALVLGGFAEGVVRSKYCGVPCQIRMDYYKPGKLVDLKTCNDLDSFEWDTYRFNYMDQLAFYHAILQKASGQNCEVHFIAVEKKEPFRCGVWKLDKKWVEHARRQNEEDIKRLKTCSKLKIWPTGYEEVRTIKMELRS